MKSINKKISTVVFILLSLISFSAIAVNGNSNVPKSNPVEFKFLGFVNEKAVFILKVEATETESDYVITVSDQAGSTFHKENVKSSKSFEKRFLFNEDIDDAILYVTVTNRSNNNSIIFKVENKTNYVKETVITEIK